MKLKKLTLQGYKTFASKTEFIFDEGITAIVGPNGSGKSNIADAVRWVLGEQSFGMLRGKRTEDMIFAGSQTRPRAGMAQAILTLDNSDGWLPIDFSEVAIGRRAYRSGENEYLLNGQRVRLKDISDLLATSGLAERTYTIIGQGLIDQALSLRADERRALFEEAAGINHYKSRRAETLRRLNETQHNLERVSDILAEIRPRLSALKGQATRARNYEQISNDLRHLLRLWYGFKWEQAKRDLREARETAVSAETTWETSRRAMLVQQQNIDDVQRRINHLQQRLAETQRKRDGVRTELEQARRDVAILLERRRAIERQRSEIEQELPLLETQRKTAAAELESATGDLSSAQASLQAEQQTLRQFNDHFEAQQAEISRWQQAERTAQKEQRELQTGLAQAEGQLSQLQERLRERQESTDDGEAGELARLNAVILEQTAVLEATQIRSGELNSQRGDLQRQRRELIDELKQQRRQARDEEQRVNQLRSELARLETRVDMLDGLRHKAVDTGPDVNVIGQLAGLITIPNEYRTALEAALASRLATLVVQDGKQLWSLLRRNRKQALLVAALNDVQAPPQPPIPNDTAVIGWGSSVVEYSAQARPVVDLLLGSVLLTRDDDAAYRVARRLPLGTLAVSVDGLVVHAGGLVETRSSDGKESILAREEAWRNAREQLSAKKADATEAEQSAKRRQRDIDARQRRVDDLQDEERRLEQLASDTARQISQVQRQIDRAQQQRSFVERQQTARAAEQERLQRRLAELETSLAAYRAREAEVDMAVATARQRLDALPIAEAEQQRAGLRQSIATAQTIVAGRQAVVDSRRSTLNQIDQQLARLRTRLANLQSQEQELTIESQTSSQQTLQEQLERLDMEIKPLQKQLVETRHELMGLQEKTAELQRHAHELETQYTQVKIRLTQRENQIEGLQERIKADLGLVALNYDEDQTGATPLPISEVVDRLPSVSELPPDIEENIHQYRGQLQRMGGINPDAPAEYESTLTRFEFLTEQVADLEQTEAQLRKVITELDDLTSRAFADTVDRVNSVFGDTFTQLFGGGSARLVLTDPDDLTISGVDIVARLPNRREQGLGLLSGGERSLTASALIFSLLKVSPTPFCVMDEVDAALDEANVNRFRALLRELSLNSQFIVITHNRGTVQAAQTVYGISMQPDSTSQSISIKPDEYVHGSLV